MSDHPETGLTLPSRATVGATWRNPPAALSPSLSSGPEEHCQLNEAFQADKYEQLALDVNGSFDAPSSGSRCTIVLNGDYNYPAEAQSVTTSAEAFACARDINDYAQALMANGVPVTINGTCREAP